MSPLVWEMFFYDTFLGIGVNDGVPFMAPSLAWSLAIALQMSPSYVGSRAITTEFILARYSRESRHSAWVHVFIFKSVKHL